MKLDSQNGKNQISGQIIRPKWADNWVQMQENDMNEVVSFKENTQNGKRHKKGCILLFFFCFLSRVGSRDCHM